MILIVYMILSILFLILSIVNLVNKNKKIYKNQISTTQLNNDIIFLVISSVIYIILGGIINIYFSNGISSSECASTGGFLSSCEVDDMFGLKIFLIFIVVTFIYYKLCEKKLLDIFNSNKDNVKWFIIVPYLLFMAAVGLYYIFVFFGLLESYHFDSPISLVRFIAIISPLGLPTILLNLKVRRNN